jgi:uncharacterized protein (TIGR03067 family)
MRLDTVTIALALLSLGFAPAPFPRPGRWAAASPSMEGAWHSNRPMLVTATHVTFGDASAPPYSRLALNRAARPATFDLVALRGDEVWWLGIYKVEGGTLTICYNVATRGRPTAFDGPGKGQHTEVFKRVGR